MILTALCLAGAALCYLIGARNPGAGRRGTGKGWILSLLIGALLAVFYGFSALGLIVSLDSMLDNF